MKDFFHLGFVSEPNLWVILGSQSLCRASIIKNTETSCYYERPSVEHILGEIFFYHSFIICREINRIADHCVMWNKAVSHR